MRFMPPPLGAGGALASLRGLCRVVPRAFRAAFQHTPTKQAGFLLAKQLSEMEQAVGMSAACSAWSQHAMLEALRAVEGGTHNTRML